MKWAVPMQDQTLPEVVTVVMVRDRVLERVFRLPFRDQDGTTSISWRGARNPRLRRRP